MVHVARSYQRMRRYSKPIRGRSLIRYYVRIQFRGRIKFEGELIGIIITAAGAVKCTLGRFSKIKLLFFTH